MSLVLARKSAVTRKQKRIALGVAALADLLQLGLFPLFGEGVLSPLQDAVDVLVALVLIVTVGFRWRTLLAFGVELIPGIALFPTWTAMVATLPTEEREAEATPEIASR